MLRSSLVVLVLVLVLALASCAHPAPPAASSVSGAVPAEVAALATRGVENPALAELLARAWNWNVTESPVFATRVGDHRFDDRIGDGSWERVQERQATERRLLDEAKALPKAALSPSDQLTLGLFIEGLSGDVATDVCRFETWNVGPKAGNPLEDWNPLADLQKVITPQDGRNLVARIRQIPREIDASIVNLRRGAAAGRFSNRHSLELTLEMLDRQLVKPTAEWPLLAEPLKEAHADWSAADRDRWKNELTAAVEATRAPIVRFRALVATELLPHGRDEDHVGLGALPDGAACYRALIREHTTVALSADELHALGEREIARIDAAMEALGEKLFATRDRAAILARLRTDPALYFDDEAQVEAKAQHALAAAKARIPAFFGVLPKAECVVKRVPDFEAPYTTIAYYQAALPNGAKPGEYMINVYQPKTRPRYEAEVLAYHESIPGHHLQIAIAQEVEALPAFRKFGGFTAYIEGWALYTESLADEMGLYSGDLDRMGMLSYDAWRASRLVVDTGIHAMGWSREKAVQYMLAHTALAENNIRNEVDRYIGDPGQALAYKVGQLTIRRLRQKAEAALGARFDLKAFHDMVLESGAVTMGILEARAEAWIAQRR